MEGAPQNTIERTNEMGFDRETVASAAMIEANRLLSEQVDETLEGGDRFTAIISLMQELADLSNDNRHIVEALAQQLTVEKAEYQLQTLREKFPEAANDERYQMAA